MTAPPIIHADAVARAQRVQLVAMDVDGTLTDGQIYISNQGEIMKGFSVHDGFGLNLLRQAGIQLAIITGRRSQIVKRRAAELQIDIVVQSAGDKGEALTGVARALRLELAQVAFVGDDWPDIAAMRLAGLAVAVAGSPVEVRNHAHWVGTAAPGAGAVRQFANWLLQANGQLAALRSAFQA
jgi:3-deoxy-D-manno-octulosonate 8-phosphate phosphatase (KDO 8-P phosphatase)